MLTGKVFDRGKSMICLSIEIKFLGLNIFLYIICLNEQFYVKTVDITIL